MKMKSFVINFLVIFLGVFLSACIDEGEMEESENTSNNPEVFQYDSFGTTLSGFRPRVSQPAKLQEVDQGVSVEGNVVYEEIEPEAALEVAIDNQATIVAKKTLAQLVDEQALNLIIYFDFKSKSIQSVYEAGLKKHANFLAKNPLVKLLIEGHADERGSREFNLGLSEDRALTVQSALIELGVEKNRIQTVGYGEEKPVAGLIGDDEKVWSANRRAVFVYTLPDQ